MAAGRPGACATTRIDRLTARQRLIVFASASGSCAASSATGGFRLRLSSGSGWLPARPARLQPIPGSTEPMDSGSSACGRHGRSARAPRLGDQKPASPGRGLAGRGLFGRGFGNHRGRAARRDRGRAVDAGRGVGMGVGPPKLRRFASGSASACGAPAPAEQAPSRPDRGEGWQGRLRRGQTPVSPRRLSRRDEIGRRLASTRPERAIPALRRRRSRRKEPPGPRAPRRMRVRLERRVSASDRLARELLVSGYVTGNI